MGKKGFTLIELMIVVAIIGILSMFALPAYQDYTRRTYISEGLALSGIAKLAIVETFAEKGMWPLSNEEAGLQDPEAITGQSVAGIRIENAEIFSAPQTSVIIVYYNHKVVQDGGSNRNGIFGNGIVLAPSVEGDVRSFSSYKWKCLTYDSAAIQEAWLPSVCREDLKTHTP